MENMRWIVEYQNSVNQTSTLEDPKAISKGKGKTAWENSKKKSFRAS